MAKTPTSDRSNRDARFARSRAMRMVPSSGLVDDLVLRVGRSRSRSITLLPFHLDAGAPSGLWVTTAQADYIVFPSDATSSERTAIVCHELAHMLLDHQPEAEVDRLAQLVALVAPTIDPKVAAQFLTRHGYADGAEAEAEQLATLLATQLARNAEASAVRLDAVSDRLR